MNVANTRSGTIMSWIHQSFNPSLVDILYRSTGNLKTTQYGEEVYKKKAEKNPAPIWPGENPISFFGHKRK